MKLRHIHCITLTVLPLALCFPLCWLFVSLVWLTCDDGQLSYPNWPCNMQGYWSQLLKWVWSRRRWGRWLAEGMIWRLGIEALMMAGKDHPEWDNIYHQIMYICQIFLFKCFFAKIVLNNAVCQYYVLLLFMNVTCSSSSLPVPAKLRELRCFWDSGYCKKNGIWIPLIRSKLK